MEYIEKCIKNSWDKIPEDIKERIVKDGGQIVLGGVSLKKGDSANEIIGGGVVFFKKGIQRKIQEMIDEMMITELYKEFSFSEEEGHKLVKIFSK